MKDIPTFLPGRLTIGRGRWADYRELERFHYRCGKPATCAKVGVIRYFAPGARPADSRVVAAAVLSYPVPSCLARRSALGISGSRSAELKFVNRNVRTISRVIVHPQFRALGLSTALVKWMCEHCNTRYVEALAVMGRAHPFFERAGMMRIEPADPDKPVYFIFDRGRTSSKGKNIHD